MRLLFAIALLTTLAATQVQAHLMPERRGSANIVGQRVFLAVSLPTTAFRGVDDDQDGRLSPAELSRHSVDIRDQVLAGLTLEDTEQTPIGSVTWVVSPLSGAQANDPTHYIVALQAIAFPEPPKHLTFNLTLFGDKATDQQVTLTVTRGKISDVVSLRPGRPQAALLPETTTVLFTTARSGAEHILTGWDHLLFLLTLLAFARGWRAVAQMTVAFTVAHCLTLSLAALGLVRLSPAIVEPAILASIGIVALDAMLNRNRNLSVRTAIVFTCGLLHGLGFASALSELGLDRDHRLLRLLSFNLGIELGQAAFVAVVLLALNVVRTWARGFKPWRALQDSNLQPPA